MQAAETMVRIPAGRFLMGSDRHYPEERPVRTVDVEAFLLDAVPVRNLDFARFVDGTGYLTVAERVPSASEYPDALPDLLVPGSAVFHPPEAGADLTPRAVTWWSYVPGACWRSPDGPGSSWLGRETHPVVHVAWEDARAYCHWAGKRLPTEAEWEYAARGGLHDADYAWGNEFAPAGRLMANVWLGRFPQENLRSTPPGTQPVAMYDPNAYGLFDMIGNTWEWTSSRFDPARRRSDAGPGSCCAGNATDLADESAATRADTPAAGTRRVIKGGSYLCAWNYCRRFRPAARIGQSGGSSTCHIGFRCARDVA